MDKYIFDESNGLWYECQGVTEQLKASNQMEWVGRMNNIRASAIEIVDKKIIPYNAQRRRGRFLAVVFCSQKLERHDMTF